MSLRVAMISLRRSGSWAPLVHTCNPNYSGGRDQEDPGSKPAQANKLQDPISNKTKQKNPSQRKGLVEWFKV
jgi:hypothetical protein